MPELRLEPDSHTGQKLGRYEILCQMSSGGMSQIYLGFQRGVGGFTKVVVLKCLSRDFQGDPGLLQMFLDEGRITAAFNHPNIGQVYDLGEQDGVPFLAMEFISGATLIEVARALRQGSEPIPIGFSLSVGRETAIALQYAHTFTDPLGQPQHVVHRDVAGKNIMVTYDGATKLFDFGIAKVTASLDRSRVAGIKGTVGYMAPEQIRGQKVDGRTDVFALGVVLHECLTGNRLFYGKTMAEELEAALNAPVPPPSSMNPEVPEEVDAVILKAVERDPAARFASAQDFARAIDEAAGYLLWRPDQRGELVGAHFGTRREQAQKLLATLKLESSSAHPSPVPGIPVRTQPVANPFLPTPRLDAGKPEKSSDSDWTAPKPAPTGERTVSLRGMPAVKPAPATPSPPVLEPAPSDAFRDLEPEPQTVLASPVTMAPPQALREMESFGDTERSGPEANTVVTSLREVGRGQTIDGVDTGGRTVVGPYPRRPLRSLLVGVGVGVVTLLVAVGVWAARRPPAGPPADALDATPLKGAPPEPDLAPARPAPPRAEAIAPALPAPVRAPERPVAERPVPDKPKQAEEPRPRTVVVAPIGVPAPPPPPPQAKRPAAPKPHKSTLILETTPAAEVKLGDRALGSTPLNVSLAPGSYELKLVGPDGQPRRLKVDMSAAGNTVMRLPLAMVPVQP